MMSKGEYNAEETQAVISVLAELLTYLGVYRENIVLIGGWVPFFLTQDSASEEPHVGSLDVDLALNASKISDAVYARIEEILKKRSFMHRLDSKGDPVPHSFIRQVKNTSGQDLDVRVDFLAPEYGGTPKSKRHQRIHGLLAHKARGSDLVFEHCYEKVIDAVLPNGARRQVKVKIADPLACVVMKAIAFRDRGNEKDAYDLYTILKYCPGGKECVAEGIKLNNSTKLIQETLDVLRSEFASIDSLGPVSVADFMEETEPTARSIRCRDVFESVQSVLTLINEKI